MTKMLQPTRGPVADLPDLRGLNEGMAPRGRSGPGIISRRWRRLAVVSADALGVAATAAWVALFSTGPRHSNAVLVLATAALWPVVFAAYGLYSRRVLGTKSRELLHLLHAVAMATLLEAAFAGLMGHPAPPQWYVAFGLLAFGASCLVRSGRDLVSRVLWRRGRLGRRTVVIGSSVEAVNVATMMSEGHRSGDRLVGVVTDDHLAGWLLAPDVEVLGGVADAPSLLAAHAVDTAVIVTSAVDPAMLNFLVRRLGLLGVCVELTSSLPNVRPGRLSIDCVGDHPVLRVHPSQETGLRPTMKRSADLVLAFGMLTLTAPLWLFVAIAIKLETRGPVFFRQSRLGLRGRPFSILKFRTMVHDAEHQIADLHEAGDVDIRLFKLAHDPRVTRVGRLIRQFSLDELPQLWNVVRNDMSLIGPRPALRCEADAWSLEVYDRLRVKPGITGMWQVSGRSDMSFDDYVRLDLYYVDNWSLAVDLWILARTVPAVLCRKGAY